jgi:hypothetical protein
VLYVGHHKLQSDTFRPSTWMHLKTSAFSHSHSKCKFSTGTHQIDNTMTSCILLIRSHNTSPDADTTAAAAAVLTLTEQRTTKYVRTTHRSALTLLLVLSRRVASTTFVVPLFPAVSQTHNHQPRIPYIWLKRILDSMEAPTTNYPTFTTRTTHAIWTRYVPHSPCTSTVKS